ncbi:hypothetical protein U9M48_005329 [Paspalum notatum var. saurae]|uniref:Uncharacterized protein n=1 Tax=Paspalum notatum var. saurae TaxID=547442 RepID=A0AAQ3SFE4_PASNO
MAGRRATSGERVEGGGKVVRQAAEPLAVVASSRAGDVAQDGEGSGVGGVSEAGMAGGVAQGGQESGVGGVFRSGEGRRRGGVAASPSAGWSACTRDAGDVPVNSEASVVTS